MSVFLERFVDRVKFKSSRLIKTLTQESTADEKRLEQLIQLHWHPLPDNLFERRDHTAAFAVDGSVRRVGLDNGAYLIIAQALCLGEGGLHVEDVDVEVLRGTFDRGTVERVADLMQRYLEVKLALECARQMPSDGVLYLDGVLYGQIPQLYPLAIDGPRESSDLPARILTAYLDLFEICRTRGVYLLSIAKTSREAIHWKLWHGGSMVSSVDMPDAELIYRWTSAQPGFSTPVVIGTSGFVGSSRRLLERPEIQRAPAIASFFIRMAEYDSAFRVDFPSYSVGDNSLLVETKGKVLDAREHSIAPILRLLASEYGGPSVYNALLYTVDKEVRLERSAMSEIYLKTMERLLGCEVPLDRSERRFW